MSLKRIIRGSQDYKKTAIVCKDRTGYWVAIADDTNKEIEGLQRTELEAYKAANSSGVSC